MIKPNELRIGNLIDYEKTTHIVCGIKGNMIFSWWFKDGKAVIEQTPKDISGVLEDNPYCDFCENHDPIPLTPEILEKCGFESRKEAYATKMVYTESGDRYLPKGGGRSWHYRKIYSQTDHGIFHIGYLM